jgi:phosphoglycerate dehydrogenase-like enzyme
LLKGEDDLFSGQECCTDMREGGGRTIRVAVTSSSYSANEILERETTTVFPHARLNEAKRKLQGEELAEFIGDAEGLIIGLERVDEGLLRKCPNLRVIAKYGVGIDNIDFEACRQRSVAVRWTPGINRGSVAELTLAFMIMLSRNIYSTSLQMRQGVWHKNGGYDLSEKTVGIIGVGNIGKEVARLLQVFHCPVLVNDIIDQGSYYRDNGLIEVSKEEIYREADIVTLHTPLTSLTRHLINSDTLGMMKKTAFLINVARGGIVAKDDLKRALKEGIIAGAALDVYEEEPPEDQELLTLPNLICTPHIGGNTRGAVLALGRSALLHLREFFQA